MILSPARLLFLLLISLLNGCQHLTDAQQLAVAKKNYQQENYVQAFQQALFLAKKDNAEAQYVTGYCYYYGLGVLENQQQAQYWFKQSAQAGNLKAQDALKLNKTSMSQ